MAPAVIEHVNIAVSDTARTAEMLRALFGWHVRWEGPAQSGGWTIHIGDESQYLAIWAANRDGGPALTHSKSRPMNHIGIVVDDLDAVEQRALALGLKPFNHDDYDPGRRFYIFDRDGIEFEIVSYAPAPANSR